MSGAKVDLDATRNANAFGKAALIVRGLEDESENKQTHDPGSPDGNNTNSSGKKSSRITITETQLDDELSAPAKSQTPREQIHISEEGIMRPVQVTDTKKIADAIRSAVRSHNSSAARSQERPNESPQIRTTVDPDRSAGNRSSQRQRESVPYVKPPSSSHHVKTPQVSEETKRKVQQIQEEAEFDMMPQTDTEKHVFWKTKLQTLRMRFKDVTIPENIRSLDWREVRKIYYMQLDRLSIGKNVDSYMVVMIVLFFIVEYVVANIFKVKSITGFAVHSIRSIHRYHRLLIELGERDYSSIGENWPVEFRIGIMILVNAVIFVIAKKIYQVQGVDHSEEFFRLYSNLGNASVLESGPPEGEGMEATDDDAGGGIMGMLGNITKIFGGAGGGGGDAMGGLGNLFSMFGGAAAGGGAKKPAKPKNTEEAGEEVAAESETAIPPPTYRRKKKKKKPVVEDDGE